MARRAKDPDEEIAELRAEESRLGGRRDEINKAMAVATGILSGAAAREMAVITAEENGETPSETLDQVSHDCEQARRVIAGGQKRIAEVDAKAGKIEPQVRAVIDAHEPHLIAKADASAEALIAKFDRALPEIEDLAASWKETAGLYSTVRASRGRRRLEGPAGVPIDDLGGVLHTLRQARGRCYPGGSKAAWERERDRMPAEQAGKKATSLGVREALLQIGGR